MTSLSASNPAARLLNIMRPLHAEAVSQGGKTLGTTLAKHFGLKYPDDRAELLRLTSLTLGLPSQYEAAMRTLDLDTTAFLDRLPRIEEAFSMFSLPRRVSEVFQSIDETTINQVAMSEALLRQHYTEEALSDSDEQAILGLLSEVDEQAMSGLSDEARMFLHRHLQSIREAILDARVIGVQPAKDAGYLAVGELVARPDVRAELSTKPAGNKFWKIVTAIFVATEVAHSVLQVPTDLKALGANSEPTRVVVELVDDANP